MEMDLNLQTLINNMERKLEMITKWLRDSGLVVNDEKTEICLFHRHDKPLIKVKIQNVVISSKKTINVLGVVFDSKLLWDAHIASAIIKAKKALYALRLLKKYFNHTEMRTLLDSNFYSVLYYNSVIWLTPSIACDLKHNLLSISANALRNCLGQEAINISFESLHKIHSKCTPNQIMSYQISLNLHRVLKSVGPISTELVNVLDQIICGRRQIRFEIFRNNQFKIGMNTTANKFYYISNKIGLDLMNLSYVHYKKIVKIQFLKYGKT